MKLNNRELATVLAALRLWQRVRKTTPCEDEREIANDGGTIDPLNNVEIDDLCMNLNFSAEPNTPTQALSAIIARLDGNWDHPDLMAHGPLFEDELKDIRAIAETALEA